MEYRMQDQNSQDGETMKTTVVEFVGTSPVFCQANPCGEVAKYLFKIEGDLQIYAYCELHAMVNVKVGRIELPPATIVRDMVNR